MQDALMRRSPKVHVLICNQNGKFVKEVIAIKSCEINNGGQGMTALMIASFCFKIHCFITTVFNFLIDLYSLS